MMNILKIEITRHEGNGTHDLMLHIAEALTLKGYDVAFKYDNENRNDEFSAILRESLAKSTVDMHNIVRDKGVILVDLT